LIKEVRLLDISVYRRICEAFSIADARHAALVGDLCALAQNAVDGSHLRLYYSRPYAPIGKQPWREVTRSMFKAFLRDEADGRVETMEEWGGELASHLMVVLAMPRFQTDYLIVSGSLRTDDPSIEPEVAEKLRKAAATRGAEGFGDGAPQIEWVNPVSLVLLGEMDAGLQHLIESDEKANALLRIDRASRGPIGLAGNSARVLTGADLAAVLERVDLVGLNLRKPASIVNARLRSLLEEAVKGPGGVLVSEKATW